MLEHKNPDFSCDKNWQPKKCKNYELCLTHVPVGCCEDYCLDCGAWFPFGEGWDQLQIQAMSRECPVCLEECDTHVLMPTQCGHSLCVTCARYILKPNLKLYGLNIEDFGCPPCPNGCQNPTRGAQCTCPEYKDIKITWGSRNSLAYKSWLECQSESIAIGDEHRVQGGKRCPLCRKEWVRSRPENEESIVYFSFVTDIC